MEQPAEEHDDKVRNQAEEFVIKNTLLYRLWRQHPHAGVEDTRHRLAVPFRRRKELLEWSHEKNGHMGITKTYDRLRERFWWAQLYADVTDWITTCDHCQAKKGHPTNVGQLQPMVIDRPWKRIGMDLMGPFPKTEEGFRHILVIVDYFSKWVEAFALKTKSSSTLGRSWTT